MHRGCQPGTPDLGWGLSQTGAFLGPAPLLQKSPLKSLAMPILPAP